MTVISPLPKPPTLWSRIRPVIAGFFAWIARIVKGCWETFGPWLLIVVAMLLYGKSASDLGNEQTGTGALLISIACFSIAMWGMDLHASRVKAKATEEAHKYWAKQLGQMFEDDADITVTVRNQVPAEMLENFNTVLSEMASFRDLIERTQVQETDSDKEARIRRLIADEIANQQRPGGTLAR